jgi:hypothetical protein
LAKVVKAIGLWYLNKSKTIVVELRLPELELVIAADSDNRSLHK